MNIRSFLKQECTTCCRVGPEGQVFGGGGRGLSGLVYIVNKWLDLDYR